MYKMVNVMAESDLGLTIGTTDQSRTTVQANRQNKVLEVFGTDLQSILVELVTWMVSQSHCAEAEMRLEHAVCLLCLE